VACYTVLRSHLAVLPQLLFHRPEIRTLAIGASKKNIALCSASVLENECQEFSKCYLLRSI
jgi:hypothetical protein